MDANGYRAFLEARNISVKMIDAAIAAVGRFEAYLQKSSSLQTADTASADSAKAFSEQLIREGANTYHTYLALLRYASFIRNRDFYAAILELLDGAEAFGNLYTKVGTSLGEGTRDRIFEEAAVPPLGTPNEKKPTLIHRVVTRLERYDPEACKQILGSGLRDLHDEWFQDAATDYAACRGIDEYLAKKAKMFIAKLQRHQREGTWWFGQEVTHDIIEYVRQHPTLSVGVREGSIIHVTKIPYRIGEWLKETDPQMRGYYACHCPWVRESLRMGDISVPSLFCHCSAAYHKKPWEVIFGQSLRANVRESILNGDRQCSFAIHLPRGIV